MQPFPGLLAGVLQVTCHFQSFTNEEEMRRGFVGGAEPEKPWSSLTGSVISLPFQTFLLPSICLSIVPFNAI